MTGCRWLIVAGALLAAGPVAAQVAAPDTAFAAMQRRGHVAMGVDQSTSHHQFTPLPDGGRITLQQDHPDPAGVAAIRAHLRMIAHQFRAGHFELPAFIHAQVVPGTAVMTARRRQITYTVDTLPDGGSVRLTTADPAAREAIHAFLEFQAQAHRAPAAHDGVDHGAMIHEHR